MRAQLDHHFGVADVNIGVMVGGLGGLRHQIHEFNAAHEGREFKGTLNTIAAALPIAQFAQAPENFRNGKSGHSVLHSSRFLRPLYSGSVSGLESIVGPRGSILDILSQIFCLRLALHNK